MQNLLSFLEGSFGSLPTPARVAAYFMVLVLVIYLMIAPRYVTGQVVAETGNGGYVPYRGVDLQTRVGGPTMKYKTNSDGDWAIPVVSSIPGGAIIVQVFHEDAGSWFDVPIPWDDTWRVLRGESFRITIKNNPSGVVITAIENRTEEFLLKLADSIVPVVTAGQLLLPKEVVDNSDPMAASSLQVEMNSSVIESYREVARSTTTAQPSLDWKVNKKSGLTYVERIQLIESLEKKHDLAIPDRHWQSMDNLGELADYLVKRKILEKADPKNYKIKSSDKWADIDTKLPVNKRPSFK